MKIAVIIPARDEAETIGDVVRSVRSVVDGDVFVVDNGSADGTSEIAVTAGARVVRESVAGYGKACMSGVAAAADADVFVFMDGDGSDRPEDIKPLLQAIERGADIALAVRRGDAVAPGSIAPAARFGNWLSGWLIALLWGRRLRDLSPLKAVRAEALKSIAPRETTYGWTVELLASAVAMKLTVVEVDAGYRHRAGGESKVSGQLGASMRAGTRILATIARTWWRRPSLVRTSTLAGAFAGLAFVGVFSVWLAASAPASFGVSAAAILISWPAVLFGAAAGAAAGALAQHRPRHLFRTRSGRGR